MPINVPQSAKLLASLKKPAETILQTYRRESRRRSTSTGSRGDTASTHSSSVNDVVSGATFIGIDGAYLNDEVSLPYPAEIDTFSVSGTIMQDAVGEFLSIFKEHLSTLADTAVKMAHEEKRGRIPTISYHMIIVPLCVFFQYFGSLHGLVQSDYEQLHNDEHENLRKSISC